MKQGKQFKRTAFNLSAKSMVSTLLLLIAMLMPQGAWAGACAYTPGCASLEDMGVHLNGTNGNFNGSADNEVVASLKFNYWLDIFNYDGDNGYWDRDLTMKIDGQTLTFYSDYACTTKVSTDYSTVLQGVWGVFGDSDEDHTIGKNKSGSGKKAYFKTSSGLKGYINIYNYYAASNKWTTMKVEVFIYDLYGHKVSVCGTYKRKGKSDIAYDYVFYLGGCPRPKNVTTSKSNTEKRITVLWQKETYSIPANDATGETRVKAYNVIDNGSWGVYRNNNYNTSIQTVGNTATSATDNSASCSSSPYTYNVCYEPKATYGSNSSNLTGSETSKRGISGSSSIIMNHLFNEIGVCRRDASHFQEPTLSSGYYQIANYGNLCWFRDKVNGGSYTINAKQIDDITIPDGVTWGGIGGTTTDTSFKGIYDGNTRTISGLKITQARTAFFNNTYKATIMNVALVNVSVSSEPTAGLVLMTDNYTTISNCYVTGSASYPLCNTNYGNSTITNCFAYVTNGAGLVASNYATIKNCYTNLDIMPGNSSNCKTSVSAATFASGEITYLLNSGKTDGTQVWYQKLGTDALPTLFKITSNTVYKLENLKCDGVTKNGSVTYSNRSQPNVDAHNWTNTTTYSLSAADCTHDAVYYKACSVCNVKGSETWTATGTALGHDHSSKTTTATYRKDAATCTTVATYWYKCSRCNDKSTTSFYTSTDDKDKALNHDHSSKTTTETYRKDAATCTTAATYWYKCSRCNDKSTTSFYTSTDDKDKALNHIMTEHAAKPATCTEAGNLLYYTCSQSCCSGKYYKDNAAHTTNRYANMAGTVIAAGHHYVDGHCSVCGGKAPITVTLENGKVKEYDSLLEAINYIVGSRMNGATLTLHQDLTIEGDEDIDIWFSAPGYDFNFTIDLNGHTITGSCEYGPNYIDIKNFQSGLTTVTIDNSCQDKIGKLFNCCLEIKAFTKVIVNEGVSIYPKFENLFKEFIVYIDTETSSLVNYGDIYGDVMVCPGGKFINNGRVVSVSGNYEENGDYCAYFNWADDGSSFSVYDGVVHYSNEEKASITSEVTKEPTCSEPGVRTFTGTYGEFTDTKEVEIPAIGHHTFDDVTDPHHTLCTVCDHSFFRYTSSTEDVVNPKNADELKDAYDAKLDFTNTYVDGQGVMEFKGTLKTIGESAFENCFGFTGNLIIPNSVTSIGIYTFSGCSGFTGNLTIPNSVTSIGESAFSGCSGFNGDLTIPNSVTSIGIYAFSGCSGFTGNLTIPNSVTSIGNGAFYGCSGFTGNLTIPNSVTSIGNRAFYECSGFTGNLTIPNSVTSIGNGAFYGCSRLTGVELNSVPQIGNDTFYKVTSNKTVVLSDNSYVYKGWYTYFPTLQSASYTRNNIKNQWGTIVVPFEVNGSGDDYDLYTLSSVSNEELTLTKVNGRLAAGTPALIRINSELVNGKTYDLTLTGNAVNAQGTLAGTPAGDLTLIGSYEVNDITENNGYIISSNKFWSIQDVKGENKVYCAPFRAYLRSSSPVGAKQLNIGQGKEATAIEAITAITEGEAEYYDINGHRINSLQKGVNIIRYSNGKTKKVLIK